MSLEEEKVDLSSPPTTEAPIPTTFTNHWSEIIPPFYILNNRDQKYKILLDRLPTWFLLLVIVFSFSFMCLAIILGMFAVPEPERYFSLKNIGTRDIYTNSVPVIHEVAGLSNLNLDVIVAFHFEYNNTLADISKNNLEISVVMEGRNAPNEVFQVIQQNYTITRQLDCINGQTFYFQVPGPNGNILKIYSACNKITLFHLTSITFNEYRASFSFHNIRSLYEKGMITGDIISEFQTTNQQFSIFESIIRAIFASYSALSFVLFTLICIKVQYWSKWHLTQKWLPGLLFFQIFYHDPIYWLQLVTGGKGWTVYQSFFSLTFVFLYLLFIMVFVHSLFVRTDERFIFKFYIPKVLLVALIWVLSMIVVLWSGFYNLANPSSLRVNDVPAYQYFQISVIVLLFVYGCYIIYYILRGVGNLSRFRDKYSNRFKIMISFSLFVILAMTSVTMIQERTRYTTHGFTFLVSHSIIFLYFNFIAFLFLPSGTLEPEKVEVVKKTETPNSGNEVNDEHFEKPKENTEITHVLESDHENMTPELKVAEVKKDDDLLDMKL